MVAGLDKCNLYDESQRWMAGLATHIITALQEYGKLPFVKVVDSRLVAVNPAELINEIKAMPSMAPIEGITSKNLIKAGWHINHTMFAVVDYLLKSYIGANHATYTAQLTEAASQSADYGLGASSPGVHVGMGFKTALGIVIALPILITDTWTSTTGLHPSKAQIQEGIHTLWPHILALAKADQALLSKSTRDSECFWHGNPAMLLKGHLLVQGNSISIGDTYRNTLPAGVGCPALKTPGMMPWLKTVALSVGEFFGDFIESFPAVAPQNPLDTALPVRPSPNHHS